MENRYRNRWLGMAAVAAASVAGPAAADDQPARVLENPPRLQMERGVPAARPNSALGQPTGRLLKAVPPAAVRAGNGEAAATLNIGYSDGTAIWNPLTRRHDKVKLRTYNNSLAGVTIEVKPGETARFTMNNNLPAVCEPGAGGHNCLNWTNLHGHGLWVSPAGNSDNVLLTVKPGVTFEYEYNIPADHPSGTYWYHPHLHGSVALQVASGMAGALIVRGDRVPSRMGPGDVDTILVGKNGAALPEAVMTFEQIPYACRDADNKIKVGGDGKTWACDPGDVGTVENYGDQFGLVTAAPLVSVWQQSGRFTEINGQVQPTRTRVQAGQVERWRLLHAGVRDTINLQIRKMRPDAPAFDQTPVAEQAAWAKGSCTGPVVSQWEVSADGLTRAALERKEINVLQPGYRSDVLVAFPEPGVYCLQDRAAQAGATITAQEKPEAILGFVKVGGQPSSVSEDKLIRDTLIAGAGRLDVPAGMKAEIRQDLEDGLKLTAFVPHKTVSEQELTGTQHLEFNIQTTPTLEFQVNGKPYDPNRIDRQLTLGNVEEWTLTSKFVGHPFHIHVNPFQVVKVLNPQGVDVTDPSIPYDQRLAAEGGDPQYLNLKGVWKDTVFVKQDYQVVMRTRYQRYIGDFVLHCHILDHEDQGMMQNVRISLPGGASTHAQHEMPQSDAAKH